MQTKLNNSFVLQIQRAGIAAICLIASLCAFIASTTSVWGTDYYVSSSTGSDQYNGFSPERPWKTLNKINNTSLNPGDRILLKRGDVWRGAPGLVIVRPGSESSPIEVAAYGLGPKPVLNGSKVLSGWSYSSNGKYWINYSGILNGNGVCNGLLEDGIPIRKASSSELLDGGWYYDGSTIYYRPSSGSVNDHVVESCHWGGLQISATSFISISDIEIYGANYIGIYVINSSNLQIRNCTVRANAGTGIAVKNDPTKAGSPCSNILIQGNTISWNANGIYLISEHGAVGLQKIDVIGNLVEYNDFDEVWKQMTKDGHGLGIQNTSGSYFSENEFRYNRTGPYLWTASDRRSDNNVFARNFVHHNPLGGVILGGEGKDNAAGNIFCFNIISDNGTTEGYKGGGFRINRRQSGKNWFVNNTLARNDVNVYLYSLTDYAVVKQNISYSPKFYHILIEGFLNENVFADNLYYPDGIGLFGVGGSRKLDYASWRNRTGQDSVSVVGDPLFRELSLRLPEHFVPSSASPVFRALRTSLNLETPKGLRIVEVPSFAPDAKPGLPIQYLGVDFFGLPLDNKSFIGAIKDQQ